MNFGGQKRRGRPLYIESGGTTISLAPEITLRQYPIGIGRTRGVAIRIFQPFAVYVIDANGVHRLSFRDRRAWFARIMLAIALLAPLPLRLVTRKNGGRNG